MAIPINVEDLINQRIVESNRVEFKGSFNPAPVFRSICAFANDIDNIGGGYIVLGVDEKDGVPVLPVRGIPRDQIDAILKKLFQYCHMIEPYYEPVAEPMLCNGEYVIVIWVSGGFGRPYKVSEDVTAKGSEKRYYVRKFSSSKIASTDEEKELFYVSSTIPFDDRPNLTAEVDDLDLGLLRSHVKEIGSSLYAASVNRTTLDIAKDLQLIAGPPEALKPRNVGILMFSEHPEKYFRYARIEVVDLPDPTGNNMVEKIFTGPIQRQLRDALEYLKNYAVKEVILKQAGKAEARRIWNYPYEAIEEILSNAVYHRSYQVREPITVRITPEGMEITSFPGFDRSITDQQIRDLQIRSRIYRNRRIGDFLKELHLIEGRNTGFPNAINAIRENGSPMLRFDMNPERDYLSVTIPVHEYFIAGSKKDERQVSYEKRILEHLQSPKTLTELAKALGYKGITAKMRAAVETLVRKGQVLKEAVDGSSIMYRSNK